ncbi:uncharacterized protein EMH_0073820 [Eimeria mitis]|uniref:GCC2 and GCC3 domain-containing protein n=1 Tax=Eimeria mitis TaxID=44415 RepID=U6K9X5_9EIME|nr:uncharacterized protein EMH_0073820 [Eimeria mitis]CDJ32273.1 hypothetical protein EMH_0073820 [Eimeria mitis]
MFSLSRGTAHQCQPCPPGKLCSDPGITNADTPCPQGSYCPPGDRANQTATAVTTCPAGYYCPEGSVEPIPCPPGKLCPTSGLSTADMQCPGGVLCGAGSSSLETATPCPVGYVCGAGAVFPVPCPRGTYGSQAGYGSSVQCRPCPGGQYCDGSTAGEITGACMAGYYCEEGSTSPRGALCPKGKVCPPQSSAPQDCPPGYSTFAAGASTCSRCVAGTSCTGGDVGPCPAGSYCDGENNAQLCPPGKYMPFEGATNADACLPCPEGTVRLHRSGRELSACDPCPEGSYCPSPGLTREVGKCSVGFYCPEGSTEIAGNICPAGSRCGSGEAEPQACQAGARGPAVLSVFEFSAAVIRPEGVPTSAAAAAAVAAAAAAAAVVAAAAAAVVAAAAAAVAVEAAETAGFQFVVQSLCMRRL